MQRRFLLAVVLLIAGACDRKHADTAWHDENGFRWRELDVPSRGRSGFTPVASSASGIEHRNDVDDAHALADRQLLIGAGVAAGDVDGDGLPDLFFAAVERPGALYHNAGGFEFKDSTAASGIDTRGLATTSAAFADLNADGALDLVVGTLGGPIKLWLGDGKGHFRDATTDSRLPGGYATTGLTFADVDGDGDLDLYVATYKVKNVLDAYSPAQREFDQVVRKVGERYEVLPQWQKEYRLEDHPELGGVIRSQRAEPDLFLENDGAGHFTRVPMSHGKRFVDASARPLVDEPDYFTLAARFYDVNGDGAPDLYACNDFEDPDQFWLNDGKGNFRLVGPSDLPQTSNTCMSVDFGDVDRDGRVDFFTADMLAPTLEMRQTQIVTNSTVPKTPGLERDQHQWMRNMLQLARGDGGWAAIGDFAGVSATDWTWGSAFVDVDLDGYEDLLMLNGHRWDVRDADTFERLRNAYPRVPWNREQGEFPRSASRSFAFRNNHDLTFADVSADWRLASDAAISQGIAVADLDGDGDMDVVATRLDAPPMLYRNESAAPRVEIALRGAAPNTHGIGGTVTVRGASLPAQTREITAGGYYLSGSPPTLSFAAGADSALSIEVRWRDGKRSVIPAARANRLYVIDERAATEMTPPIAAHRDTSAALFEDATRLLGGHTHVDPQFVDFRRQPLLPNRFSQLGPGVSWIDTDADGRADLVVGSGHGGRLTVLRNTGAGFGAQPIGAPVTGDLTTVLPLPDNGRTTLLAGQSNYEMSSSEAMTLARVLEYRQGSGATPAIPGDTAAIGPLALADVDGDGRLDLFVGARVVPGLWPLPAPSRIYLRTAAGGWVSDSANARAVAALGLVSAALWTDLDGDGWPELVATAEWGPVRVLHNDHGTLRDVTRDWGLSATTSRWNGLSAGDFDGDGLLDLVVTSWGRNTPWQASASRPYVIRAGNFGGAGLGFLPARIDSATGKEMPLASFEQAAAVVPGLRERIPTFHAYSKATVDEVLGPRAESAVRIGATTFDHLVLLNRRGHFDVRALPGIAQLAPAFAPVVADFDGDGHEDLFLAQNFFPTATDIPRFDAGSGLVLLGDGRGGFRALTMDESGVRIRGDQRGAAVADYDSDGRPDVAVSQNGAPTTLWHNRHGRAGTRVRLDAGADNPWGVGAQVRIGTGPVREIRLGSAYWSSDDPVTVLAPQQGSAELWIRWPGGSEQRVPLGGQREVTVRRGR